MNAISGTVPGFLLFLVVLSGVDVLSFDQKCPPLKLFNGRSRYRWRGRSVRFNCIRGFQLVGAKYATCMNGKWDADVPICVKYGCRAPSTTHVNGQFLESYRGAVVKIVCNPGYTLVGSPSVFCNGIRWNETFPVCRVRNSNPGLSCNFEEPDLCGWSQDPMHDFDWKRQNTSLGRFEEDSSLLSETNSMENGTGYYMYMNNSSPEAENDVARLYSPVYPPDYSNNTCFKFSYYMNGLTTGFLKAYVKPEGVELFNLIPSFWVNEDQGKTWLPGFFPIEPTESPFQIVFEGVRGPGSVSDTAFDDVRLVPGEECTVFKDTTSSTESSTSANPDDEVFSPLTCKNRCNEEGGYSQNEGGEVAEGEKCDCHDNCLQEDTCCSDYFDFCQSSGEISTSTITETDSTTSSLTSKQTATITTSTKSSPKDLNNESNDISPLAPVVDSLPKTSNRTLNEIPKTTKSAISKPKPQIPEPERRHPQPPPPTIKNSPDVRTENSSQNLSKERKTANRTEIQKVPERESNSIRTPVNGSRGKNQTKAVNAKPESETERKGQTATTPTTPPRGPKPSKPNKVKLSFVEKPSNPNLSNESRFHKGKSKEISGKEPPQAIKIDKKEETETGKFREIIEIGGTCLAILVIITLGVFWYRRSQNRKTERESMVEDSDSIVFERDSSTLASESHSLVCIRAGTLR